MKYREVGEKNYTIVKHISQPLMMLQLAFYIMNDVTKPNPHILRHTEGQQLFTRRLIWANICTSWWNAVNIDRRVR